MTEVGDSRNIPNYLKASSPQGLRRLMLRNNIKDGCEYNYVIIAQGNTWYAWFKKKVVDLKEAGDLLGGKV